MKNPIQKNNYSDEQTINIFLELIEKNGINKEYISVFGYSEDRICLEIKGKKILVYYAYRNNKNNLKEHKNIYDALLDIADRCSETKKQYDLIITQYKQYLNISN